MKFRNNGFIKTAYNFFLEEKDKVLRIWNRKGKAVRKWRSRAWNIDPKKTKITIIKVETSNIDNSVENLEIVDLNLADPISSLPLYMDKPPQLPELKRTHFFNALTDIEQVA